MASEIIIIVLLLLANGIFAMAEMAVVSARQPRLRRRAEQGDRRARAALELARRPDDFLSTVQIGITLVGILAGAFGGATLAQSLAEWLGRLPAIAPYAKGIALAIVVGAIGFLTLVVGELLPKRLALINPERIASIMAAPMRLLSRLMAPVVWLLTTATDLLLRMFHFGGLAEPPLTEDEIKVMIEQGAELGVLSSAESEAAQSMFKLGERRVGSLMTPRTEITWLDAAEPWEEQCRKLAQSGHSRAPVCEVVLDNVLGVVEAKSLLACEAGARAPIVREVLRPTRFVPETLPAVQLLDVFQQSGPDLALVVDEFGGIQGLVTLHDVLNAVMGDVTKLRADADSAQATVRPDGSWLLDGMLPSDDFKALFRLQELPGEELHTYETLGGFVMMQLGRVPEVADRFEWAGLELEVVDMDGRRVDKVLVIPGPVHSGTS